MLLQEELQLPRLTGTLRTFSNVSKKFNDTDFDYDKNILKKRKEFIANKGNLPSNSHLSDNINWPNLVSKLIPNINDSKYSKLKSCLDKLRLNISKQFLNEDFNDSTLLNEASLFIFEIFYEFRNINNSSTSNFQNIDKLNKKLKEKFGQFPRNIFDACKDLMESLFNELTNLNQFDTLNNLFLKRNITTETSESAGTDTFFGENIKFSSFYDETEDYDQQLIPSEESENEDSSSETEDVEFNFLSEPTNQQTFDSDYENLSRYIEWTKDVPNQISTIIYELLSKSTNSNELQNELVELIGFEKIELVEYLLTNRDKVVNAYKLFLIDNVLGDSKNTGRFTTTARQNKQSNSLPTISSEITIHTEAEKKIKKQIRKEEKKLSKYTKTSINQPSEFESFNPVTLRQIREEQLQEARILQLYHQKKISSLLPPTKSSQTDQYPYVFDSMLKIAQTSAYIAGSKILLPESIRRMDSNQFEEVFIPPSESLEKADKEKFKGQKEEICLKPLIKIEDLDFIGQIAFRNIKTLNRIQSIVFDEAYNTNQNLLICAPTGAGKTNIAMLTIVNQIRKNFVDGVLRRDDFKIVYIAPMKALAAEMVDNFSNKLQPLGIVVKELTGDMQLTKQEILNTQILVTTPEKWDVVTRKSLGDTSLSLLVKLLIIDEVHLLHDDRGSVIETIVARTLRQVESSQKMIRIVGLSATLPNYIDVARFLNVDPRRGLFFFDGRFRPVPLAQTFIGVKSLNKLIQQQQMDEVCYEKVLKMARQGHQVMVFVHARNATIKTALKLREMAKVNGDIEHFLPEQSKEYGDAQKQMQKSRNKQLREIFDDGFSVHHAGMLRSDRNLVEKCFINGHIKVLVCTATLAWGVNLPAHAVVIKGTELYDSKKGSFVDLSMLDVLQIFGRAGRPQYDKSGEAFIITTHDKLSHYLSLLTRQCPIESQFINSLADNLNAEVCLGSVTNVDEGSKWLSYTYLHVRMKFNPLAYGLTYKSLENDPNLELHRQDLIRVAARLLDKARMVRFDEATGILNPTDLGRTASHYYIKYDTIEITNEKLKEIMNDKEILGIISDCSEFKQLKVRDEELEELDRLLESCELTVLGGIENTHGKVNCLIQAYISRNRVDGFSLISDMAYIGQNVSRIARALFEMSIKRGWALLSGRLLNICKSIEKQIWYFNNPMRQFENMLTYEIISKIEDKNLKIEKLRDMNSKELGYLIHHQKMGEKLKQCIENLPQLEIDTSLHPITRTVLRVKITLTPNFTWNDKLHGASQFFWVWIEDPDHDHIYHNEYFNLQKKHVKNKEPQVIVFTIPIFEPLPAQYIVRVISDIWLGVEFSHSISFKHLILPEQYPPHTELLDLHPLPITALNNPLYQSLYSFAYFNPIQTQVFFCLYHTDNNVLLGAPTGSGKTITAELAMFRVFNEYRNKKCVYIAPLKALVRERMNDWKYRLEEKLGKKVVELTGDVVPDMKMVAESDVIVTTPEKWDGISRSWQTRNYVKDVALIIIDEIHLLGEDRGPVLEVIVSRTNFISSHTNKSVRIVGLSTALANAVDLADWLGIKEMGMYNFRPSVRPVPLEVHIQSFAGKFYCPRMASMNKPCFQQIKIHSRSKPVLIFVSSRRQTRLTALDLISCLAAESNPKQWLDMPESEINVIISQILDQNLKLTLAFGIGLHHAGLSDRDRKTVEELFLNQKIQILIATSTLAWGLNFPAHLVIVKGTEYYDGKTKRYIDFPITDVLQMMGRAGRPQFDDSGIAVIMVHDVKKHFYKKFLYEPFPVESSLLSVLPDHLCAEIVASTITSKQEAMEYLTWTYFFRRLLVNPSYYQLESLEKHQINSYLSSLVMECLKTLESSYCISIDEDGELNATICGKLSSYYYLTHSTLKMFNESLSNQIDIEALLDIVSMSNEFDQFPVRHNEDKLNAELSKNVPLKVNQYTFDSPHTKVNLLLQAHYSRVELPIADYITDTKSVLDQCLRIMQAILDFSAEKGWLLASINIINLMQMSCQGRWISDSDLLTMPHIETQHLSRLFNNKPRINCLPSLIQICENHNCQNILENIIGDLIEKNNLKEIYDVVKTLPIIDIKLTVIEMPENDSEDQKGLKTLIDTENESKYYEINEGKEYLIEMDFSHRVLMSKFRGNGNYKHKKAYAPKYPKEKDENWIVLLGANCDSEYNNELIALKRINSIQNKRQTINLLFKTPLIKDLVNDNGFFMLTLYFMSDVYMGLDQQYNIRFNLKPKNFE